MMRYSFAGLWLLGIICAVWLTVAVVQDFRMLNTFDEQAVALPQPLVQTIVVKPTSNINFRRGSWLTTEPFGTYGLPDESAYVANVSIRIKKSPSDSLKVTVLKVANGASRMEADQRAQDIQFSIAQQDSILLVDPAIIINKSDKFRNQSVEVTVYLPVGHKIVVDKGFNRGFRFLLGNRWNERNWYYDDRDYRYSYGDTYVMKDDGLFNLSKEGRDGNEDDWNSDDQNNSTDGYRYRGTGLDSLKEQQELKIQKMQRDMDSVKAEQERQMQKIKDSLQRAKDEIDQKIEKLNATRISYNEAAMPASEKVNPFFMRI